MKTLTLLGCSTCIIVALSGCGSDPITLGELIAAANDGEDSPPADEEPATIPPVDADPTADDPTPPPTAESEANAPPPAELPPTDPVEQQVIEILTVNCGDCHIGSADEASAGLGYIDDIDLLIENGMIVPGSREASRVYERMDDQSMPPSFERQLRPTLDQIEFVGKFIDELE